MSEVTKRALEQSLKNLLLKKPLTKITINDITEDCGINRMTFYYHFKDIYDLVEWSCLEDARKALEEKKTHDTWQEGFLNIFEAVLANKPFVMNVYRCVDREQVEKYLKPLTDGLIMGVIDEQSKGITVRDEDISEGSKLSVIGDAVSLHLRCAFVQTDIFPHRRDLILNVRNFTAVFIREVLVGVA